MVCSAWMTIYLYKASINLGYSSGSDNSPNRMHVLGLYERHMVGHGRPLKIK